MTSRALKHGIIGNLLNQTNSTRSPEKEHRNKSQTLHFTGVIRTEPLQLSPAAAAAAL